MVAAPFLNAGKALSSYAKRLSFSVFWLGKAQFLSIEKAHFSVFLMQKGFLSFPLGDLVT